MVGYDEKKRKKRKNRHLCSHGWFLLTKFRIPRKIQALPRTQQQQQQQQQSLHSGKKALLIS